MPELASLLSVYAAGVYFVPPAAGEGEAFPARRRSCRPDSRAAYPRRVPADGAHAAGQARAHRARRLTRRRARRCRRSPTPSRCSRISTPTGTSIATAAPGASTTPARSRCARTCRPTACTSRSTTTASGRTSTRRRRWRWTPTGRRATRCRAPSPTTCSAWRATCSRSCAAARATTGASSTASGSPPTSAARPRPSGLLDPATSAWGVQLDVRVAGSLDAGRMRRALDAVAGVRGAGDACLTIADCDDDDALDLARRRLHGSGVALTVVPPMAVCLAHHPAGDVLMLNLNHAAVDAFGAAHVLGALGRAYARDAGRQGALHFLACADLPVQPIAAERLAGRAPGPRRGRAGARRAVAAAAPRRRRARRRRRVRLSPSSPSRPGRTRTPATRSSPRCTWPSPSGTTRATCRAAGSACSCPSTCAPRSCRST